MSSSSMDPSPAAILMVEEPRRLGRAWRVALPAGCSATVLRARLDAAVQRPVNVWVEAETGKIPIATLSPETPAVAAPPPAELGREFVMRHDCPAHVVRFGGDFEHDPPPLTAAPPSETVVPDGEFLGPARFAAVENTAGFMRVAAAEGGGAGGGREADKKIIVLYRYAGFWRTWSARRRGVEACRPAKPRRLRFAVPPAGDMASSLAWAGAALGPLIYPPLFRRQLQELWSSLAAPAVGAIPPRAARLQVVVDVGILRREDHTPERMEHMRGALEAMAREAWPAEHHVCKDMHLPEPVRRRFDDGERPTKRRRVAEKEEEEEECSVCLEPMASGAAAWPGCGHVFHGACLEKTPAERETCPLCRRELSEPLT
ncbi:hypothetical protein ACP4OV_029343 [Aristida adscensionis]